MKPVKESAAPPQTRRKLSHHQRSELINQGQRMSNWMYNVSQFRGCPEDLRGDMKLMVESWDKIRHGEKHLLNTKAREGN